MYVYDSILAHFEHVKRNALYMYIYKTSKMLWEWDMRSLSWLAHVAGACFDLFVGAPSLLCICSAVGTSQPLEGVTSTFCGPINTDDKEGGDHSLHRHRERDQVFCIIASCFPLWLAWIIVTKNTHKKLEESYDTKNN